MIDLWFMFFCWVGIGYMYFWNFSVQFEIRWSAANQKRMMFVCFFSIWDKIHSPARPRTARLGPRGERWGVIEIRGVATLACTRNHFHRYTHTGQLKYKALWPHQNFYKECRTVLQHHLPDTIVELV